MIKTSSMTYKYQNIAKNFNVQILNKQVTKKTFIKYDSEISSFHM